MFGFLAVNITVIRGDNIEENKQMAIDLYTNYCHARNITFVDVKKE